MDWSNENMLKFVESFETEQLLWNPRAPKRKDRIAVRNAWDRIQQKMNCPLIELKRKKDVFLASYRKLAKKVYYTKKIGKEYKVSWFAYDALDKFLHNIYVPRAVMASEKERTDNGDPEEITHSGDEIEFSTNNKVDVNLTTNLSLRNGTEQTQTSTPKNPVSNLQHKTLKFTKKYKTQSRKRNHSRDVEAQNQNDKILRESKSDSKRSKDHCTLYTDLLCVKLRALDETVREVAMHEIDNIVFRLKNPATCTVVSNVPQVYYENSSAHPHYNFIPSTFQQKNTFGNLQPESSPHGSQHPQYSVLSPYPQSQQASTPEASYPETKSPINIETNTLDIVKEENIYGF